MKNNSLGMLNWLWLSTLVLILDQLSKHAVVKSFYLYEQLSVVPSFFSLTLAYNSGAAFSFLSDQGGWQRWFFVGIASVVSLMLVSWLHRMKAEENWQACAMALILGGALGNLYDRIVNGYVVDFLLVYYKDWYFPSFNLADVGITIGAGMLIIDMFRPQPKIEE
ncbi:signal peptidase II [Endozoicomonas sp. OPT23]|uniref:signal peptidase II n=1 Tax=Endozoicomonas sp. OPT23 TaxID=2072845 RepID=UPI00129ACE92|nr:signal peptidase II [Endozoicomonas sp. OPT23]MRI33728.1 signal peptidase II [Endozoicomonas sp. OPT23]